MSAAEDLHLDPQSLHAWTLEIEGITYGLDCDAVHDVQRVDSETSPSSWQTPAGPVPRVSLGGLLSQPASNAAYALVLQDRVGAQVALTVPLEPRQEELKAQALPDHLAPNVREVVSAVGARDDGSECLVLDTAGLFERVRAHRRETFQITLSTED